MADVDLHPGRCLEATDYGKSWRRLDAGLAQHVYVHAVREDPVRKGLLYLGTERGVMCSPDGGATWQSLKLNMPTVAVHDLVVKDNDLVVATHGRSLWILDDLTPGREWTAALADQPLHLFPVPAATQWGYRMAYGREATGPNPPDGATFTWWLKAKPADSITAEILDAAGRVIRRLSSTPRPRLGIDEAYPNPAA